MPGVEYYSAINFPLLLFGRLSEAHLVKKEAFQELDARALLMPYATSTVSPEVDANPSSIFEVLRTAYYARPGNSFINPFLRTGSSELAIYNVDVLIFVFNNGGIYYGDCDEANQQLKLNGGVRKAAELRN
jgi:hypothetical protein